MEEKIEKVISGKCWPRCNQTHLYRLSDKRFKCVLCHYKYSSQKIMDDLKLLHYFSLEIPANKAAKDLDFGYNKVRTKYMQYRQDIARYLQKQFDKLSGEIECDESYFGGKRKGARGRGSQGKIKVFGILERQGKYSPLSSMMLQRKP